MKIIGWVLVVVFGFVTMQVCDAQRADQLAYQLFSETNQARAQNGLPPFVWDSALVQAAAQHAELMARQGRLSHQYTGEPDLVARASTAGAHFRKIAENVALGPSTPALLSQWMKSPPHRANILDPQLNAIGIAVVRVGADLYATQDFSGRIASLSSPEIERQISDLLTRRGIAISTGQRQVARQACEMDSGFPEGSNPGFIMRWEGSDLTRLPKQLEDRLTSGRYHSAAVGACSGSGLGQGFTSYHVAVLLFY
jgi:Cysteine-rich secretory protein family